MSKRLWAALSCPVVFIVSSCHLGWFLCSSPRPFLLINCGVFSHTETTITTCGLIFTGHAHCRSCHRVASQSAVHAVFLTHCLTLILSFHFLGSPSARVVVDLIHVFFKFFFLKCFVTIFVVLWGWRMGKLLLVWLRNTGWLSGRAWEHQFILILPEKESAFFFLTLTSSFWTDRRRAARNGRCTLPEAWRFQGPGRRLPVTEENPERLWGRHGHHVSQCVEQATL